MTEKHTVAMFAEKDGTRTQVGWASPADSEGVRTFEFSPGFNRSTTPLDEVTFEDDEQAGDDEVYHETAVEADYPEEDETVNEENYPQDGDEGKDSPVIQVDKNETVEIAGGSITSVEKDEEEAEFERELAAEQAQTRREAREQNEAGDE